jgi:hypothetical protein
MAELDLGPYAVEGQHQELFISRIRGRNGQVSAIADTILGPENWQFGWRYGSGLVTFLGACQLYRASYERHFDVHPKDLDDVSEYSEVFDVSPEDIGAGTDFARQGAYVHVQDIAIRAIMQERGRQFNAAGSLLQVRSTSSNALGVRLSPFNVGFLDPDAIMPNPLVSLSPKWPQDSVEAYYQCNRRLLVTEGSFSELLNQRLETELGNGFAVRPVAQ